MSNYQETLGSQTSQFPDSLPGFTAQTETFDSASPSADHFEGRDGNKYSAEIQSIAKTLGASPRGRVIVTGGATPTAQVGSFTYVNDDGDYTTYAGVASLSLTDGVVNKIWVDVTDNTAKKGTAYPASTAHIPLAGWDDSGGSETFTDERTTDFNIVNTAAVTDHGALGGLADDDHTQYLNNTRGDTRYYQKTEFITTSAGAGDTGKPVKLDAGGHIDASMINDVDIDHDSLTNYDAAEHRIINDSGTSATELWSASKINTELNAISSGLNRRTRVIDLVDNTAAPPTEVSGDRYIIDNTGTSHADWDGASANSIVEFNGTTWDATAPSEGWIVYVDQDNKDALFVDDGTPQWEFREVAITDHGSLSGLTDDDHTIYLKADGTRALTGNLDIGGNILTNGVNPTANDHLATKGYVDNITSTAGPHAGNHIHGGTDVMDGDKLEVSYVPTNYVRTTTPSEVDNVLQATAHFAGIDNSLASISGSGEDDFFAHLQRNSATVLRLAPQLYTSQHVSVNGSQVDVSSNIDCTVGNTSPDNTINASGADSGSAPSASTLHHVYLANDDTSVASGLREKVRLSTTSPASSDKKFLGTSGAAAHWRYIGAVYLDASKELGGDHNVRSVAGTDFSSNELQTDITDTTDVVGFKDALTYSDVVLLEGDILKVSVSLCMITNPGDVGANYGRVMIGTKEHELIGEADTNLAYTHDPVIYFKSTSTQAVDVELEYSYRYVTLSEVKIIAGTGGNAKNSTFLYLTRSNNG